MGGTYTDRFQKGVEFNILVDPLAAQEVMLFAFTPEGFHSHYTN